MCSVIKWDMIDHDWIENRSRNHDGVKWSCSNILKIIFATKYHSTETLPSRACVVYHLFTSAIKGSKIWISADWIVMVCIDDVIVQIIRWHLNKPVGHYVVLDFSTMSDKTACIGIQVIIQRTVQAIYSVQQCRNNFLSSDGETHASNVTQSVPQFSSSFKEKENHIRYQVFNPNRRMTWPSMTT